MIPDYTVRESKKAKHVGIKLSVREGMVIVVPYGYNQKKIPSVLKKKQQWITKNYKKIEKERELILCETPDNLSNELPNHISLRAISEEWDVEYRPTTAKYIKIKESCNSEVNSLIIYGPVKDKLKCRKILQNWLNKKARNHLIPWLDDMSIELGLQVSDITIRNQSGRWGSCSSKRHININQKLLFLPEELVSYIFIHELCHIKHMNHSKSFWSLIKQFEPDYKEYERQTKADGWHRYIPLWSEKT